VSPDALLAEPGKAGQDVGTIYLPALDALGRTR
jgi:hypothetical protein